MRLFSMIALFALSLSLSLSMISPASAAEPMTASEFESYTTGKTLNFYSGGSAYGVERYRENRKVTWSFLDGDCKDGEWYQQGRFICFIYDGSDAPQCWTFFKEPNGLRALFEDNPEATELYETSESDEPMICLGPEVGV